MPISTREAGRRIDQRAVDHSTRHCGVGVGGSERRQVGQIDVEVIDVDYSITFLARVQRRGAIQRLEDPLSKPLAQLTEEPPLTTKHSIGDAAVSENRGKGNRKEDKRN